MRASVALLFMLAGCAAPQVIEPTYERVVAQFETTAFGSDFGPGAGIVLRWTEPMRMATFAPPGADVRRHIPAVTVAVGEVIEHTGIGLVHERDASRSTLRLGFFPRAELETLPPGFLAPGQNERAFAATSACAAILFQRPDAPGIISGAAIIIGTDIPEAKQRHCILEEFVQAMGLPADACHYRPSLFCEDDRVFELTPADRLLLKALYDPRLKPGMPRAEAMPVVREVIREAMR